MKRILVILFALAVLVSAVAGPVAATGHFKHTKRWRPVYLALGDSVAAGQEADDWEKEGYVPLFHDYLREEIDCFRWNPNKDHCKPLLLKNLGRPATDTLPGVTSALVIEEQLPKALKIIERRHQDRWKFNNVKMITVNVGGNDISGPLTDACVEADPTDPDFVANCFTAIELAFSTYAENLTVILGSLRQAAPKTPIIMATQYNPIYTCDLQTANPIAGPFADFILEGGTLALPGLGELELENGFNDVVRMVAAGTGVEVAEVFEAIPPEGFVGGTDCLHPNTIGHEAIYQAHVEAFED